MEGGLELETRLLKGGAGGKSHEVWGGRGGIHQELRALRGTTVGESTPKGCVTTENWEG